MPTEPSAGPSESSLLRWVAVGCQAAAIVAWLLLVFRYQYGAAWLQGYDESFLDFIFLAAVSGAAFSRGLSRRIGRERLLFAARIVLPIGMTVLALVVAEYAARFQFRRALTSGNAGDYIAHSGAWYAGPNNSLGFREREVPPKVHGRYRIAVVGDSFTWGAGIERNERFSNLLEQFLGSRYEVFNFGVPGNNMPQHLAVLDTALTVQPDFVLLQLYINDFETQYMQRPHSYPLLPESLNGRLSQSSLVYDLLQDKWTELQQAFGISEGYVHYMDRNLRDENGLSRRESFGNLKAFFERTHAAGIGVGAVLFPETDALGPNGSQYPFKYLHDGVRQACIDERVQCLDLLPLFSTFRDPRAAWVSAFDAHPNAMANRRAAYEILQTFGRLWLY